MGINMKVNRLPSRTWNWLKMNESSLKDIEINDACEVQAEILADGGKTPAAQMAEDCSKTMADGWDYNLFDGIATGMGPDMTQAVQAREAKAIRLRARTGEKEKTVRLCFPCQDKKNSACPVDILAEEDSSITVIMEYTSAREAVGTAAVQTRLRAEKNAKIRLIQLQVLGDGYTLLNDVGASIADCASVETLQMFLGSGRTYTGMESLLEGKESRLDAEIGYLGRGRRHFDMNYVAIHQGELSKSRISARGVLREEAFKLFRGTIDFKTGSFGAEGEETEDILLMGDNVINQTIPLILCGEENVQGNHGATIGRLDEELLFYLSSRGLSKEDALSLVARARMDAICNKIGDERGESLIQNYLEEVMGNAERSIV